MSLDTILNLEARVAELEAENAALKVELGHAKPILALHKIAMEAALDMVFPERKAS